MRTTELAWFKSSYSGDDSGDCVEAALEWRKSTYSGDSSGDCVEVAACPATIRIRDSKNKRGPQLALSPAAWGDFVELVVSGLRSTAQGPGLERDQHPGLVNRLCALAS